MHMGNLFFKLVIYTTIMNKYWRQRKMNELVKKELERNVKAINEIFGIILEGKLPNAELIKMECDSIRILIDYCEKLVVEGESAIETLD